MTCMCAYVHEIYQWRQLFTIRAESLTLIKKHSLNSFLKLAKTKNALRHQSCNVNAC